MPGFSRKSLEAVSPCCLAGPSLPDSVSHHHYITCWAQFWMAGTLKPFADCAHSVHWVGLNCH